MSEGNTTYQDWLAGLDEDSLTALLLRRPEVMIDPPPRSFGALQQLLTSPSRVAGLPRRLDRGALDLLELFALMGDLSRAEVGHWAGEGTENETSFIDAALDTLVSYGLVWPKVSHGLVEYRPVDLSGVFSHPFGLARRQRKLFRRCAVEQDRLSVLATLQIDPTLDRGARADAVAAAMTPGKIRALFDDGPQEMRDMLSHFVDVNPVGSRFDVGTESSDSAFARGLLYRLDGHRVEMPLEVSVALRGEGWRLPITLTPPRYIVHSVDREVLLRSRSLASLQFCEHTQALLTSIDTDGLTQMKTGGISAKDIRGLTTRLGFEDDADTALILMLAKQADLIAVQGKSKIVLTAAYETWSTSPRADQATTLVAAWWCAPFTPTHRVPRGSLKTTAVLKPIVDDPLAVDLRGMFMAAMTRLIVGDAEYTGLSGIDDAMAYLRWHIPKVLADAGEGHARAIWTEAERLGVIADGAPTEVSNTLCGFLGGRDSDRYDVECAVEPSMRDLAEYAPFVVRLLPDSTAVVSGPPSTEVAALLGRAAVPESRGVASVWRFTPDSIRAWFDGGGNAEELIEKLTDISATDVPQALEYTVRDCWRTYGALAVRTIPCALVSDDVVLLNEIESNSALAELNLVRLAPTVLVASVLPSDAMAVLRRHGYTPVRQTRTGQLEVETTKRARSVPPRTGPPKKKSAAGTLTQFVEAHRSEPNELARRLISGEPVVVDEERVRSMLSHHSRLLPRDLALLAAAVAQNSPVTVDYQDYKGAIVRHTISDSVQDGHVLHAFSERTKARESYAISNIRMVVSARS